MLSWCLDITIFYIVCFEAVELGFDVSNNRLKFADVHQLDFRLIEIRVLKV